VDPTFTPPITPPSFPPVPIMFDADGVRHIIGFWSVHRLYGYIGDKEITDGYTISIFHAKIHLATGKMVLNGQTWFYFNGGYFTGTINGKGIFLEVISGTFTLHGFEDFEGMKLFGIFCSTPNQPFGTNDLSGIILIPNEK